MTVDADGKLDVDLNAADRTSTTAAEPGPVLRPARRAPPSTTPRPARQPPKRRRTMVPVEGTAAQMPPDLVGTIVVDPLRRLARR